VRFLQHGIDSRAHCIEQHCNVRLHAPTLRVLPVVRMFYAGKLASGDGKTIALGLPAAAKIWVYTPAEAAR